MEKNRKILFMAICALIVVVFFIWYTKEGDRDNFVVVSADYTGKEVEVQASPQGNDNAVEIQASSQVNDNAATPEATAAMIKIYITGAVISPGVYELPVGARIEDALTAAGGASDDADMEKVNLSKKISDEQHIKIPRAGETVEETEEAIQETEEAVQAAKDNGKVNINTANKEQLKSLPGIGDVIAGSIIEYREANGPFQNIEDLKNVYRIGDKVFEQLKGRIMID